MRGAIIWAGLGDPLGGVHRIREEGDEDADHAKALLYAWSQRFNDHAVTVAEAVRCAGSSGALHDALAAYSTGTAKISVKTIGYAVKKLKNRPFGELTMVRAGADR